MKRTISIIALALITIGSYSFVSENNAKTVAESYQGGYHYDLEWEAFKEAVYAKNADDLNYFLPEGSAYTADEILMLCGEDYVINAMKKTTYEKLGDSEYNGNYAKEFSATVSGTDEEGNEYESGIFLYFEEGLEGLRLVNVLAAG
ncbi:hypothetical protein K6119_09195 [Paracrocinitomix mangrovi]|uniref:hypothetical protein n=1 Tax=Paracrocinitomix mangrovi TaxID=2862509 RepID=UPI001C8E362D|nr:hypothetical protein [Paracrocinitomix mangrovi]UKN03687.1 hypothetical protein K6119_09195 [Paracrocinitomix mangrovi]